jgi:hypothetical protein
MLAETGAFTDQRVGAGEDPVEVCVVVGDRLQTAAQVREHLANLFTTGGQPPLREQNLRVVGEQVENAAAGGGDAAVIEGLEVFQGNGFALFVGHRQGADHGCLRIVISVLLTGGCQCSDLM